MYTQYSVNRTGIEKKKLHLVTLLTLLFPFHQKKYRVLQLKIVRSKMTRTENMHSQPYVGKAKRLRNGRFFFNF